jgi:hypothetical protein
MSAEKVQTLCRALGELQPLIREIDRYSFGPDLGLREDNMDFCITADFRSAADYQAYAANPAYLKVVAEHIKPNLAPGEPVARCQFEMDISSNAKQSLMKADPPLFDTKFGASNPTRADGASD